MIARANIIDDLWKRVGEKLRSKGIKPKDISRAIKEARKMKRQYQ